MSALDHETSDTPNTIDAFDRAWPVPARIGLKDTRRLDAILRAQMVTDYDGALAEAFLSDEDFAALVELNPDPDQMDDFGNKIAAAVGLGGRGNS